MPEDKSGGGFDPWSIGTMGVVGGIQSWQQGRQASKDRRFAREEARKQREHELEMLYKQNLMPEWAYKMLKQVLSTPIAPHGKGGAFASAMGRVQPPQMPGGGATLHEGASSPIQSRMGGVQ